MLPELVTNKGGISFSLHFSSKKNFSLFGIIFLESRRFEEIIPLGRRANKFDGKYHIKVKDNAVSYAVDTPQRIALSPMTKLRDKLVELERQGVISKVDQPTDWCAPVVAVPKSNGDVRVFVDLAKLNDSVKCK